MFTNGSELCSSVQVADPHGSFLASLARDSSGLKKGIQVKEAISRVKPKK
jgi:hypothetical protein